MQFATSGDDKEAEAMMRRIGETVVLKEKSIRPLEFMLGRTVTKLKDGAIAIMRRAKIDKMTKAFNIQGKSNQPAKTTTDFHTVIKETEQQEAEVQRVELRELVGMQQYIAIDRKDVCFVVNNLSRYVSPERRQLKHWFQARVLAGYSHKPKDAPPKKRTLLTCSRHFDREGLAARAPSVAMRTHGQLLGYS
jgi:hypothetical protein